MKRVLVCGGREFANRQWLDMVLDKCGPIEIISGMARGADRMAAEYGYKNGMAVHEFPADWDKHKKAAGPIRNQQMIDEGHPDAGIAFPGGTGTADMIRRLKKAGIPVLDLREKGPPWD